MNDGRKLYKIKHHYINFKHVYKCSNDIQFSSIERKNELFFFSQNIKIRKRLQNVDNHIIYKTRCSESTVPEQEEGVYLLWRGTSVFAVSYVGPPSFCCLLQRARGTDQEILS